MPKKNVYIHNLGYYKKTFYQALKNDWNGPKNLYDISFTFF